MHSLSEFFVFIFNLWKCGLAVTKDLAEGQKGPAQGGDHAGMAAYLAKDGRARRAAGLGIGV
jgi:hypothetical protein